MDALLKIGDNVYEALGLKSKKGTSRRKIRYGIYYRRKRIGGAYTKAAARKRVKGKRGYTFRKLR